MNEYLLSLVNKYKSTGILVDSNLFLLYLVGSIDSSLISRFKRTSEFSIDDFEKVSQFIDFFDLKITTPHILTEVSNLLGENFYLQNTLRTYISKLNEVNMESVKVGKNEAFVKFGLTDTAIITTSGNLRLIFTKDMPLFHFLCTSGIDAVSLEQVRTIRLD